MNENERFWSKVNKNGPLISGMETPCWEWVASKLSEGYGQFWTEDGRQLSHRFSWKLEHGFIPDGMDVCHHCDNTQCVRPEHLFLGSPADNQRDCIEKGRDAKSLTARHRLATHCPYEHVYAGKNLYRSPDGRRQCRTCQRQQVKAYQARRRLLA